MAKAIFTNQTTPTTPTSGKTALYVETTTKKLESVDDAGVVTKYASDADLDTHVADTANPHATTKSQVGLANVTNDAQLKIASNLSDLASASTARTNLGLGTVATLASDTDGTLAANSDTSIATQKAVKTYVDNAVSGLLDFKGNTDCSANPNYPSALKGDAYIVSVAGKIGGASGPSVDVGDVFIASADNAGGDHATVGTSWFILEHNVSMDHGTLSGLSDDDHSQYLLLSGRSGGQTVTGDTASGGNLTLRSTSHATKGKVIFGSTTAYDEVNDRLGVGTASPSAKVHLLATTEQFRVGYDASNYYSTTVSSVGVVTFDAVGSGSTSFAFSDRLYVGLPTAVNDFKVGTTSNWTQTTGSYAAFSGQINAAPTASSTAVVYGTHMEVGVTSANAQNMTAAQGLIGFRLGCQHRGTGTITGYVGIICNTPGFSSSGAITNSYALYISPQVTSGVTNGYGVYQTGSSDRNYFAGSIAVGFTTAPTAKVQIRHTSEQQRIEYDASNYYSTTVGSTGGVTFDAVGTGARFTFSDRINIPTSTPASASATGTAGDIAWDADYIYVCTAANTWKRTAIATW